MSDPSLRDPRLNPPPLREEELRVQRLNELESSNAMWGWIAGAVVLALVLMFVFTRGQIGNDTTASNVPPPAATITSPPAIPTQPQMGETQSATPAPKPSPTTTGSGGSQ